MAARRWATVWGLNALGGINNQDGALTCLQSALDLVGEVNVTGGIDQVHFKVFGRPAIWLAAIDHAYRAGLDSDALFPVPGPSSRAVAPSSLDR